MLCLTEQPDDTVKAKKLNPAVSVQTIREVQQMMKSGLDIRDIVDRLRTQTVRKEYPCHPWRSGM